ncbi:MAG TPA: FAD binding domain-containing protein [Candidatus Binatia bacterium]|jgi:CO/xanthine dehydrogenase FAD-binding subunit|nr:FAD binding domain-containing protein [Candidatus Binatia bacterium]
MDLNTITEIARPNGKDEAVNWREGDAWLAGGTWLFSEPQPHLRRLIDLEAFGWEPFTISERGLDIASTCKVAQLDALAAPADWQAAPLLSQCCRSLLASFKIWNTATVGGNICMSLPAGSMISLAVALEGICTIRLRDGSEHQVPVENFVTGNHQNVLQPGDLLRRIELPASALRKRTCFRRMSLTHLGRSSTLLVGTLCPREGVFMLTVTAATVRPLRLTFPQLPHADELQARLGKEIPDSLYLDDVHGAPAYRKHLTVYFAEKIRHELAGTERP